MATNYSTVIKEAALRINGIAGALVADIETNYSSTTTTTTALDNPRYPPAAIKDAILDTEAQIALAIANTKDHAWRFYMEEVSGFIDNGTRIPVTGASSGVYIGQLTPPYDTTTAERDFLREADYEDVAAYLRSSAYFGANPLIYAIRGGYIYHTGNSSVYRLLGCVFSRSTRATQLASNGAILFPDVAVPLYYTGAVSLLFRDGEYSGQATQYKQIFDQWLQMVVQGEFNFRQVVPEPPLVARASL